MNQLVMLFAAIMLLFTLSGCQSDSPATPETIQSAVEYSGDPTPEKALLYNNIVLSEINRIVESLRHISEHREPYYKRGALDDAFHDIAVAREIVAAMETFDGNGEFKNAAIELIAAYQSLAENEYQELVDIISQESHTATDTVRYNEIAASIMEADSSLPAELMRIQVDFAKKYGIELE